MHPSLLLPTSQYSRQCTKVTLITVMVAVRPVAGPKKAEIRHGLLVSRERKFAKLTGIWVWVWVHEKD